MKNVKRGFALAAAAVSVVLVAACAQQPQYSGYPASQPGIYSAGTQNTTYARYGRVSNIEYLQGGSESSGMVGAIAGGAVGGVLGNQVGKGSGRTAATIVGAVGGALLGSSIEKNNSRKPADYRVTVQFDDGTVGSFDFAGAPAMQIGDRVRADGNQLYRS